MKYIRYISIALVWMVVFSCRKEPRPVETPQHKIEFQAEIVTRSFITDSDDADFKKGFAVFASKTEKAPSSQSKEIMTNVKVSDTSGQWTYSPDVWWGLNCDHDFLAVYPYRENGTDYTFGVNDKTYHITSVKTVTASQEGTYIGTPSGEDIMYARHQDYYDLGMIPQPIVLNFRHALTAVSFKFRNVSGKTINNITGISLKGLYTHAIDLAIPRDPSKEPTMKLDVPVTSTDPAQNSTGSEGTYKFADFTPQSPIVPADQEWKLLTGPDIILPQTLVGKTVPFEFTVNFVGKPSETYSYNIEKIGLQSDIQNKYDYLPGKHYIYRIDILDKDIKFSVYVTDWIENGIIELK